MKKPQRKNKKPRNRNKNSMLEREEFAIGGLTKFAQMALDVAGANLKNVKKADGTPSGGVIRRPTEKDKEIREERKSKIASGESLIEEMPRNTGKITHLMGPDAVNKFRNLERVKTTTTLSALGLGALALNQFLENSGIDPNTATEEELEAAKAQMSGQNQASLPKNFIPYVEAFSNNLKAGRKRFSWMNEKGEFEEHLVELATDKDDVTLVPQERVQRQEGGEMTMPPEMMEEEEVPVDTYPNATPEELEAADQRPDAEMEANYMEFVIEESLSTEEQTYLLNTLEADPQLSMIFDKVVETASEFSGAGEVEGPGTGLSDSIPARLSDGEFVMTKKATDQIGADNLQQMMDDAERAYDGGMMRQQRQLGGLMADEEANTTTTGGLDEDLMKAMSLKANKAPSLS
tara:strand:- start:130 stop:1344 length:1215 start_codon:yes stop_codon:yes gene_type:complete